ncbi:hypothetical protein ACROYT_G038246 [Oculina patagonica]
MSRVRTPRERREKKRNTQTGPPEAHPGSGDWCPSTNHQSINPEKSRPPTSPKSPKTNENRKENKLDERSQWSVSSPTWVSTHLIRATVMGTTIMVTVNVRPRPSQSRRKTARKPQAEDKGPNNVVREGKEDATKSTQNAPCSTTESRENAIKGWNPPTRKTKTCNHNWCTVSSRISKKDAHPKTTQNLLENPVKAESSLGHPNECQCLKAMSKCTMRRHNKHHRQMHGAVPKNTKRSAAKSEGATRDDKSATEVHLPSKPTSEAPSPSTEEPQRRTDQSSTAGSGTHTQHPSQEKARTRSDTTGVRDSQSKIMRGPRDLGGTGRTRIPRQGDCARHPLMQHPR